jgi:hypothetical protein
MSYEREFERNVMCWKETHQESTSHFYCRTKFPSIHSVFSCSVLLSSTLSIPILIWYDFQDRTSLVKTDKLLIVTQHSGVDAQKK